jgi:hypothetical protein
VELGFDFGSLGRAEARRVRIFTTKCFNELTLAYSERKRRLVPLLALIVIPAQGIQVFSASG